MHCNHEVESWLQNIENLTHLAADAAFIKTAKSALFGNIFDWSNFKKKFRVKIQGICSSRSLYENRILPGQAPLDIYLAPEGVYLGYSNYQGAIGEPEELLRRAFLQGLPCWVCEVLVELDNLVGTAHIECPLWSSRKG